MRTFLRFSNNIYKVLKSKYNTFWQYTIQCVPTGHFKLALYSFVKSGKISTDESLGTRLSRIPRGLSRVTGNGVNFIEKQYIIIKIVGFY